MLTFSDDNMKAPIEQDAGVRPPFTLESFTDVDDDVRSQSRNKHKPVRPGEKPCPRFVYNVKTGRVREVT